MSVQNNKNKENSVIILRQEDLEVWVRPEDGMNICRVMYCDVPIIEWDHDREASGGTYGTPLMFPTPNRVDGGSFKFADTSYEGIMHGIVRKRPFTITKHHRDEKSTFVTGSIALENDDYCHQYFPFEGNLYITIKLENGTITWSYMLNNQSDKELPYGIGLHPFFVRHPESTVRTKMEKVMMMNEAQIPTGQLVDALDVGLQVDQTVPISSLNIDHVFTKLTGASLDSKDTLKTMATMSLGSTGIELTINVSDQFSHLVVYVPEKGDFFCVEPQTCSTDCHNLYYKGYKRESGLEILAPKGIHEGRVEFRFSRQINDHC